MSLILLWEIPTIQEQSEKSQLHALAWHVILLYIYESKNIERKSNTCGFQCVPVPLNVIVFQACIQYNVYVLYVYVFFSYRHTR